MPKTLTLDQQWAKQMAESQLRDMHRAMLMVQSRIDGFIEFAVEAGCELPPDMYVEATKTMEQLQRLAEFK